MFRTWKKVILKAIELIKELLTTEIIIIENGKQKVENFFTLYQKQVNKLYAPIKEYLDSYIDRIYLELDIFKKNLLINPP